MAQRSALARTLCTTYQDRRKVWKFGGSKQKFSGHNLPSCLKSGECICQHLLGAIAPLPPIPTALHMYVRSRAVVKLSKCEPVWISVSNSGIKWSWYFSGFLYLQNLAHRTQQPIPKLYWIVPISTVYESIPWILFLTSFDNLIISIKSNEASRNIMILQGDDFSVCTLLLFNSVYMHITIIAYDNTLVKEWIEYHVNMYLTKLG